jgi:transcriptional regulator with XRE-family HTH domain
MIQDKFNPTYLRNLMQYYKLTGTQLAKDIGVTKQSVSYWRKTNVPKCWHKVLHNYFKKKELKVNDLDIF